MPSGQTENPIVRQLYRMGAQWQSFASTSDAVMGVWKVDGDTTTLVDGFPFLEDSEQGIVPSIFLTFEDDFSDPETYAYDLIKSFLTQIAHKESRAALEKGGVNIDLLEVDEIKDTGAWVKLLADFAAQVELLSEGHFVAYFKPYQIADQATWKQWMSRLLSLDIPEKIRFMAKEEPEFKWVEELAEAAPGKIHTMVPDVDLDKAMREIVDEGLNARPDDPAMQFRQAMLQTGQAAGKQNMTEAEEAGVRAMIIAEKQQWAHLQIGIYFTLANGYIGVKDYDQAISQYRKAQVVAQQYQKSEEISEQEMAGQLWVQAMIGEAGCYLGMQDFSTGADKYAEAAPIAEKINKQHLALEAWRMTGFCYQYLKEHRKGWDYYRLAWAAGEKLEPEMRTTTTLPYVGQALIELRPKAKVDIKEYELEDEIIALLGKDWKNLIKTTAS